MKNHELLMRTVQISPFRTLMTALKDILVDTNIVFDKTGIKIINMDKSHTILVHLQLLAENFEEYYCNRDKITVGVNMVHLAKLIDSIENTDTLTIYIEKSSYNDGIVSELVLKYENGDIKQCKTHTLRLIEPDHEELKVPDVHYTSIINMPSGDFQRIIRDMGKISDKIEITSVESELIFKCIGQFACSETRRAETQGSMEFVEHDSPSSVVQGEFSLRNLTYFIKCTNLCNQISIYLGNGLPLVVRYDVASLGFVQLCLAPLPSSNN